MLKPRGAICNLDCSYCYYLSKEKLYEGSAFRMSEEVLEDFTRQYIRAQPVPEAVFGWQGGEPLLMGVDFFKNAVELQQKYRPPGMHILNTIQTNGVKLDEEWCDFLRENGFLVGISIDGPAHLHDPFRVDKGGNPSFDGVMAGLDLLKEHGVEWNVLTTVHAVNAGHPLEAYRFLRDEVQADFVQFIPIVQRENETGYQEGDQATDRSVTGAGYGDFLMGVFDEWVQNDVGRIFVQIFDIALAAWVGQRPGLCIFDETCGTALVLEHNGDLYACDHFVEPKYHLGNLATLSLTEMMDSDARRAFGLAKWETLPRYCRECEVRFVCNGGCPKNRFLHTPDGEQGLNYLCEGYRAFFNHIGPAMRYMAEALQERRAPADIMRDFAPDHYSAQVEE